MEVNLHQGVRRLLYKHSKIIYFDLIVEYVFEPFRPSSSATGHTHEGLSYKYIQT